MDEPTLRAPTSGLPEPGNAAVNEFMLWAVSVGDANSLRYLLHTLKANPATRDPRGLTPLMLACEQGRIDCVRILADLGSACDPEARAPNGFTALLLSAQRDQPDCALLILRIASPFTKSEEGRSFRALSGHFLLHPGFNAALSAAEQAWSLRERIANPAISGPASAPGPRL